VRNLWPEEEHMARAYLATPRTASVAEISTLTLDATAKGRTVQAHCEIIVEKADTFRAIATVARRLFLETDRALEMAGSSDDMEEVLDLAKGTASSLAELYGLTVSP
jgi:hypothetical protein